MCTKYEENVLPIINELYTPLLQRFLYYYQKSVTPKSEEEREVIEVKRLYYSFIHNLLTKKLIDVLTSEANSTHLQNVINIVLQGCKFYKDSKIQKNCFKIFKELISKWGRTNKEFDSYVLSEFLKTSIEVSLDKELNITDLNSLKVLKEIAQLHYFLQEKYSNIFLEEVCKLLSSIGLPNEIINLYSEKCRATNKEFSQTYEGLIKKLRSLR